MPSRLSSFTNRFGAGNFHVLLVCLFAAILFQGFAHDSLLMFRLSRGLMFLVLMTSLRVVANSTVTRVTGRGVILLWIIGQVPSWIWGEGRGGTSGVDQLAELVDVLATGWILAGLALVLMRMTRVNAQMLSASLCAYVMLGIWFFNLYTLLPEESFLPPATEVEPQELDNTRGDLFYFSFVTLTSLGYGDVSPATPLARSIAIIEVVLGQFFLAVLIARQVGMFLVSRKGEDDTDQA